MFQRDAPRLGDYMRRGLEPMARRLGVDFDESFFNPPTTDEARVFDAYRCGESLLMNFTYPDGWPTPRDDRGFARLARKAAKVVRDAIVAERGPDAISYMAQGYAHEMANLWRRGAADEALDSGAAGQLRESAARSDALSELAAKFWPVSDPFGALDRLASYERQRVVDLDNPDAMIDLRAHFGRAGVACGGAALALGPDVERYAGLLYGGVAFLDVEFAIGIQHDWAFQAEVWGSLLSDRPRAYAESMRSQ